MRRDFPEGSHVIAKIGFNRELEYYSSSPPEIYYEIYDSCGKLIGHEIMVGALIPLVNSVRGLKQEGHKVILNPAFSKKYPGRAALFEDVLKLA